MFSSDIILTTFMMFLPSHGEDFHHSITNKYHTGCCHQWKPISAERL